MATINGDDDHEENGVGDAFMLRFSAHQLQKYLSRDPPIKPQNNTQIPPYTQTRATLVPADVTLEYDQYGHGG